MPNQIGSTVLANIAPQSTSRNYGDVFLGISSNTANFAPLVGATGINVYSLSTTDVAIAIAPTGVSAGTYTGHFVVDLTGRIVAAGTLTSTDITTALGYVPMNVTAGAANGYAQLDGTSKLTASQVPTALLGAVVYQSVWNASTNTPTLQSGTGVQGQYYKVSVAGTTDLDGCSQWYVGDLLIFDGVTWDKVSGPNPLSGLTTTTNSVVSVAGLTGTVTTLGLIGAGLAPLTSPNFLGTPTAPAPSATDNSNRLATTAFVKALPVSLPVTFTGKPTTHQVANVVVPYGAVISATLAGFAVYASTAPTAAATFTVSRIAHGTPTTTTSIGAIVLAATSHNSVSLSGAATTFSAGDVMQIAAPSTQDSTMADVGISAVVYRT